MDPDQGRPGEPDLREATLSAVRWVAGARIGVEVVVFGASLALARLIPPAEFGRAAIALIITAMASTLIPAMFGARLVQRRELDREHLEAGSWLGLVGGIVLALLAFALARPLGAPLFGDQTADLIRLASPAFLLAGFTAAPQAILQRRLDFRKLTRIELASAIGGAAVAVSCAVAGLDAEAIVFGALTGVAIAAPLTIRAAGLPRPVPHREALVDIVRFGFPAGFGSFGYLTFRNIDYAIIGARLGAAQLGAFWRGFQLGVEYQRKISVVMLRVAFPVYSRTRDLDHVRALRTRIVRTHATVIFPLLALLIALAPELVPFLYGDAWKPAVVPAQILAGMGMLAAVQTGLGPLMLALGRSVPLMIYTWSAVVVYGTTVYFAAPYGLTAVCAAAVASSLGTFLVGTWALNSRIAGIPMRSLVGELGPAICGCLALLAVALPLTRLLSGLDLPAPLIVAVVAVAGLGAYGMLLRRLFAAAFADVALLARRALGRPEGGRVGGRPPTPPPGGGSEASRLIAEGRIS